MFCYRFFSRFCESQGADPSTHDMLFTYSEQNRPDKSQRVNVPLYAMLLFLFNIVRLLQTTGFFSGIIVALYEQFFGGNK